MRYVELNSGVLKVSICLCTNRKVKVLRLNKICLCSGFAIYLGKLYLNCFTETNTSQFLQDLYLYYPSQIASSTRSCKFAF